MLMNVNFLEMRFGLQNIEVIPERGFRFSNDLEASRSVMFWFTQSYQLYFHKREVNLAQTKFATGLLLLLSILNWLEFIVKAECLIPFPTLNLTRTNTVTAVANQSLCEKSFKQKTMTNPITGRGVKPFLSSTAKYQPKFIVTHRLLG